MGTNKFKNQINKNKELKTSTDEVTEALYKEAEKSEIMPEPQPEERPAVNTSPADASFPSSKGKGRPKGDDTIRKTIYIPQYNWPYVQAAQKIHGGNLQKYLNDLIQNDIDRNREKYKELADLYRSIDGNL